MNSEIQITDTLVRKEFIDSKTLLTYQNRALFSISILSIMACIYYNYTKSHIVVYTVVNIISSYCFVDLFFIKHTTSKLHHLFALFIFIYGHINTVKSLDGEFINYMFCRTEVSSIFLVLKCWLNKKTLLYKANLVAFYILFFKMRIIDFYAVVSPGSPIYIIDAKYSKNNYMSLMLFSSIYGYYALYIYWFIQINMVLYKQLFAKSIEQKSQNSS